jgi:hypothetical protein
MKILHTSDWHIGHALYGCERYGDFGTFLNRLAVLMHRAADRAAAVIFAHNHPSGELKPSNSDLKIHEQLTEAAKILGLRVLDHLIVSKKGYYSFQEAGLIH